MYKNILVAFDGSDPSMHAAETAIELVSSSKNAVVTILKVAPSAKLDSSKLEVAARMAGIAEFDESSFIAMGKNYVANERKKLEEGIEKYFESLPDNVDIKIVSKIGVPHEVICEYAEEIDADCIVMGRRGLGAVRSALGSVSFAVLRDVDLPVLVVK